MSDIEREEFEQAVTDRWSNSYSFTRFGDEDYYDEVLEGMWRGWQASRQAPVAAKAAQPTPVNKGAHPERPSTAEIMSVLASHYGVDTGVVALWIHEIKVQEAT